MPEESTPCPHCGSHLVNRGKMGLDLCNTCGGLSREGGKLRVIPNDETIIDNARQVAEYWRVAMVNLGKKYPDHAGCAHPLCMVLMALQGETDLSEMGLNSDHDFLETEDILPMTPAQRDWFDRNRKK